MNSNQEPEDNFIDSGSSNIRVENISKSFFGIDVLNSINLDFNSGEIHGLVGQNGAGKSTIIDALTYGLFGKSFKKLNNAQLINSINVQLC